MASSSILSDPGIPYLPGRENSISRRYLTILQKWLNFAMQYYSDWDLRPECGHFFGGVHWYGLESSFTLKILALVLNSPEFDPETAGYSKEELIETGVKVLRYLCCTHDTGPEECVRPAEGLGRPENCSTKWGEKGKGFFRESQCGRTVANMVLSAILLKDRIDPQTCDMLAAVCTDYLDRFGNMEPKSGVYIDTQCEENAWTALGLAASYLFLGSSESWEENAKKWMFRTSTAPQDNKNSEPFTEDVTVRELCGTAFTFLPDYMAENHGMVHPNYTGAALTLMAPVSNLYRILGKKEPKHIYWNRHKVYENLKHLSDPNGIPMPVQGMDWPYLAPYACLLHAAAYTYLDDTDSIFLEQKCLQLWENIFRSNNFRMVNPEVAAKCSDQQDPMIMRELWIASLAGAYLCHRLFPEKDLPGKSADSQARSGYQGVKTYPHSGFIFHKHSKGQTSFSWRNNIIIYPQNRDGILTVAPCFNTLTGNIILDDGEPHRETTRLHINEQHNSFDSLMINSLDRGTIRQEIMTASLPSGNLLVWERFTAEQACTVQGVEQGHLEIMNEKIEGMNGNCKGFRVLYFPGGSKEFKSLVSESPDSDVVFTLDNPGWINVDNKLGFVFSSTFPGIYHNKHYFNPFRAITDDLYLVKKDDPGSFKPGEVITDLYMMLCPEQSSEKTAEIRLYADESPGAQSRCLITEDWMLAGNFGNKERVFSFAFPVTGSAPLFPGMNRLTRTDVEYSVHAEPEKALLKKALGTIQADADDIHISALSTGELCVNNSGKNTADIHITALDKAYYIRLEPGETEFLVVE